MSTQADSRRNGWVTFAAVAMFAGRQLVLGVAEAVADAKGGVKLGETAALDAIRDALSAN